MFTCTLRGSSESPSFTSHLHCLAVNTFHTLFFILVYCDQDQPSEERVTQGHRGRTQSDREKKNGVLLVPRCVAALFKSYWSSINTFNCFLWFPGLWSVTFQVEAAFLTLLHTCTYPARHPLGQNVEDKNLCLLEAWIIVTHPFLVIPTGYKNTSVGAC